jgi:hypothetical protein
MESCQDISASVWNAFVEDALAQIKLAQERKMEDMRQSCTSLTTKCLASSAKSISDFDARALSVFGVSADLTVNAMCAGVKDACNALLDGDVNGWDKGMTDIATDKTYATIMQTCTEVGKNCIIQNCKSISGNFGLCENIDRSVNRHEILNQQACWDEVMACVASAGNNSINEIFAKANWRTDQSADYGRKYLYSPFYGPDSNHPYHVTQKSLLCPSPFEYDPNCTRVFDVCYKYCEDGTINDGECRNCRLTEKIWGNCEYDSNQALDGICNPSDPGKPECKSFQTNKILQPKDGSETLLWWFAKSTNTSSSVRSCSNTCPSGYKKAFNIGAQISICAKEQNVYDDLVNCEGGAGVKIAQDFKNCCSTNSTDAFGNCCMNYKVTSDPETYYSDADPAFNFSNGVCTDSASVNSNNISFAVGYADSGKDYILLCMGGMESRNVLDEISENISDYCDDHDCYPDGQTAECKGRYVLVDKNAETYIGPNYNESAPPSVDASKPLAYSYYIDAKSGTQTSCYYGCTDKTCGSYAWGINVNGVVNSSVIPAGACGVVTSPTNGNNFLIRF